jgi:predicted exporter
LSDPLLSVHRLLARHAFWCKLGSLVLLCICAYCATRIAVREDIRTLMPTEPAGLAKQFLVLRDAPFMQELAISVEGDDPGALARTLAARLAWDPLVAGLAPDPDFVLQPTSLLQFCEHLPGLLDAADYEDLAARLTPEAVTQSLDRDARLLQTPRGLALRDLLAMDPLGLCGAHMRNALPELTPGTVRMENGLMLSADGRHALLLVEPAASMTDSAPAGLLMERIGRAAADLPAGSVSIAGGHRHSADNAAVIKGDLQRILPVSSALLALAFLVFVRTVQGLFIILVPVAAVLAAAAVTSAVYGDLSGIVLGFGSVVLGITADYAIHVYFAVKSEDCVEESLVRVSRPLLVSAATTVAALAAFLTSSIPCVVQMSVFALSGIGAAVLFSAAVLPLCLTPGARSGKAVRRPLVTRGLGLVWPALLLLLAGLACTLPIDGDVRALSFVSDEAARDEDHIRNVWGGLREQALIAVRAEGGDSLERALERNDRLWAALRGREGSSAVSLAPLLPSQRLQASRHARWSAFWKERSSSVFATLEEAAGRTGFRPEAFAPFKEWTAGEPPLLSARTLAGLGLDLPLRLLMRSDAQGAIVYTLIDPAVNVQALSDTLEEAEADFVSGQSFREALASATTADLLKFGSAALLGTLGLCAFALRSGRRVALSLLPVGFGLAGVCACFHLFGLALNLFHVMALPLVLALSVDYGVFMTARLGGAVSAETERAVLLSGLTSLSGFGALLLARHPALFSLGLTVSLGLFAALISALVLLPCLTRVSLSDGKGHE